MLLDRPFGFHHQPTGTQQRISDHQPQAAHHAKGRQPIEYAAGDLSVLDAYFLQQSTQYQPLRKCRNGRTGGKRHIPLAMMRLGDTAKLEGHATKDQCQHHHDHRQIHCRHDHRICKRKCDQQPVAAQHQPGFIAIPERRDGIHHLVAFHLLRKEREKNADAQVESVQHHIHRHRSADHQCPNDRQRVLQILDHGGSCPGYAADNGRFGSPSGGGGAAPAGTPRATSLRIYQMPMPKVAK